MPPYCREATEAELLEYIQYNGVPDGPELEPVDQDPPHEAWCTW